jgi:hypothetical protein
MNNASLLRIVILSFALSGACLADTGATTAVSTVPSGYFTLNIPAGTGTASTISALSFPLRGYSTIEGRVMGAVTGITAATITDSAASWTPGQLSVAASPYLIEFLSGNAAGRTFLLSTSTNNSSTTVTLDPNDSIQTPDLTALVSVGDQYQIIPADTISSIFGTPASTGVVGGNGNSTTADQITIITPGWTNYYYDTSTTPGHWLRVAQPHTVGDNIVIRPDSGVFFSRYGTTPITLTLSGQVPIVARQSVISNGKATTYGVSWPVNQTLSGCNFQNIPGWIASSSVSTADTVVLFSPVTGWRTYFYNGTHWMLSNPSQAISDSLVIPAGTTAYISKQGTLGTYAILKQPIPYSL